MHKDCQTASHLAVGDNFVKENGFKFWTSACWTLKGCVHHDDDDVTGCISGLYREDGPAEIHAGAIARWNRNNANST